MKILHIIDTLGLGGAQTLLKGIFEKKKNNNDIFIFALRSVKPEIKIISERIFTSEKTNKYSFSSIKNIKTLIRKENITILHCHLFKSCVFGYLIKRFYFKNIKLIFHEHGNIIYVDGSSKVESLIYKFFIKTTVRKINLYISITKAMQSKLQKCASIPDNKIQLLYNYIDINKFKPAENYRVNIFRKEFNFKENEFIVGFAARIVKRKGWREFIKAAKLVISKNNLVKFLIAGSGEEQTKLKNLIKNEKIQDKVVYIGFCDNMYKFYSVLNCFVIPSHWEPMGITELEAQAMKIPVIASDVSGLNEIVIDNKNGLLFEAKNHKALSEKINMLIENPEISNKIIKGGSENIKKYDINNYITQLNNIYTKI